MEERLQKILARAGIGSRRASETLIEQGRVILNGKVATLGMKADAAKDHISVDGKKLKAAEPLVYFALYKPRNVISAAKSPDPRPTVRDLMPHEGHLYPVGRLDIESEGLIIMTNDGNLANKITHPRYGCEKEYRVLVARVPDEKQLKAWRNGVVLEDGHKTQPAKVFVENPAPKGTWLSITMKEGRKRQIREIGERLGLPVTRLRRVRIGPVKIGRLKARQWRELTGQELRELNKLGPSSKGKPRSPRNSKKRSSGKRN